MKITLISVLSLLTILIAGCDSPIFSPAPLPDPLLPNGGKAWFFSNVPDINVTIQVDTDNDGLQETMHGCTVLSTFDTAFTSRLAPGDQVFFKRGDVFTGINAVLSVTGLAGKPIVFGDWGDQNFPKPVLQAVSSSSGVARGQVVLTLLNVSHIQIRNLDIRNSFGGIHLRYDGASVRAYNNRDIIIEKCNFANLNTNIPDEWKNLEQSNYEFAQPTGIMISGTNLNTPIPVVDGVTIRDCDFYNNGCGIGIAKWFQPTSGFTYFYRNITIDRCLIDGSGNPPLSQSQGIIMFYVDGGTLSRTRVTNAGGLASSGTTGVMMECTRNYIVEDCVFEGTRRAPLTTAAGTTYATMDGCGFDFEGQCTNISFRKNIVRNNAGYAILIMRSKDSSRQTISFADCLFYNNLQNCDVIDRFDAFPAVPFLNTAYEIDMNDDYIEAMHGASGPCATGSIINSKIYKRPYTYSNVKISATTLADIPIESFSPSFLEVGGFTKTGVIEADYDPASPLAVWWPSTCR